MKTLRFLGTALIATLMCVACSNEEIVPEEQEAKYVTVNLGVTGEYLKVSESPMDTRTTSTLKDLIGIQVYTISDNNTEIKYAWGVFNSLENVSIKLLAGEKYKFETSIIVDGYGCPEYLGHYSGLRNSCHDFSGYNLYPVGEDFNYSSDFELKNFKDIPHYVNSNEDDKYKHDRFYGELVDYTPNENGTVEITTKRTAYGAHYIAEGLTEGNLKIEVTSNSDGEYTVNLTEEAPESNGIYGFRYIWSAWKGINGKDYYSTKHLTISWTKDDGSETPLGTFDITFKRNIKTTIVIKVADPSQQNGIVVTKEETRMTDDENKYVIEGGTITEVPVTSQQ
ncbi:MAG: hypothetical protein IKU85_02130 [Bacteroidaceae bacterium]|nr:hypothetical protein [Bacteroidaceae bacterium]